MTKEIKYYRAVIKDILRQFESEEYLIKLEWISGSAEEFEYRRKSHKYTEKFQYKLTEARMQLGNSLKYISEKDNPYRQASLDRMVGNTDNIPDPVDEGVDFRLPAFKSKIRTIDYLRELFEEMKDKIIRFCEIQDDKSANIHLKDAINKISLAKNYLGRVLYCIKKVKECDDTRKIT